MDTKYLQRSHREALTVFIADAGVVPIAYNSGGPAADIVTLEAVPGGLQATGYLCTSEDEYAAAITEVLAMDQVSRLRLAGAARRCAPVS